MMKQLNKMKEQHQIIGDVRGKGLLLAIDLVKNKDTREPFVEAGTLVYESAFAKGLAWIPAGNILRIAPSLTMTEEFAGKALEIIEESITEAEKHFGC